MNIPTVYINSAQHSSRSEIEFSVPLCGAKRFPVVGYIAIFARILGLFYFGNPTNVILGIVATKVYAIQGMIRGWLWANIFKEFYKTFRRVPFGTNLYAHCAISNIRHAFGIVAPCSHVCPRRVFGRTKVSICMAMLLWGTLPFPEITSARHGPSISEFVTVNEGGVSAIAFAFPSPLSSALARYANRDQAAKPLPGNILGSIHNAVVSSHRCFGIKPEEAQQREGSFRGIPLSGSYSLARSVNKFNT